MTNTINAELLNQITTTPTEEVLVKVEVTTKPNLAVKNIQDIIQQNNMEIRHVFEFSNDSIFITAKGKGSDVLQICKEEFVKSINSLTTFKTN